MTLMLICITILKTHMSTLEIATPISISIVIMLPILKITGERTLKTEHSNQMIKTLTTMTSTGWIPTTAMALTPILTTLGRIHLTTGLTRHISKTSGPVVPPQLLPTKKSRIKNQAFMKTTGLILLLSQSQRKLVQVSYG